MLHRYIYWTDWGNVPKIERSYLDGDARTELITSNLQWPNGLTIGLYSLHFCMTWYMLGFFVFWLWWIDYPWHPTIHFYLNIASADFRFFLFSEANRCAFFSANDSLFGLYKSSSILASLHVKSSCIDTPRRFSVSSSCTCCCWRLCFWWLTAVYSAVVPLGREYCQLLQVTPCQLLCSDSPKLWE